MPKRSSSSSSTSKAVKKFVKRELTKTQEQKYHYMYPSQYNSAAHQPINNSWNWFPLLHSLNAVHTAGEIQGPEWGTGPQDRTGNKIFVKWITVNVSLKPVVAGMDIDSSLCRLVVLKRKKANGTQLVTTDVFKDDNYMSVKNAGPLSSNYVIVKDLTHTFVNTGATTSAGPEYLYTIKIPVNKLIEYRDQQARGYVSVLGDDYYIGAIADATGNCCKITLTAVISYTDA